MLKNYFKTAWRNLRKHPMLSVINIAGLSIGLACVMLIMLFVNDEYSFDRFQQKGNQLYRLTQQWTDTSGKVSYRGNTGIPHGPVLAAEFPEIESFCRLMGWEIATRTNHEVLQSKILFVDSAFFDMFSFPVQQGNPNQLLHEHNAVVLSERAAEKYFGSTKDVLGKTIEIELEKDYQPFVVTGVVKAPPVNSSIQFDLLVSFAHQLPTSIADLNEEMSDWSSSSLNTFFLVNKNADMAKVQQKLSMAFVRHNAEDWSAYKKKTGVADVKLNMQPFLQMHTDKTYYVSNGLSSWSDSTYSYVLSGLALLILAIAAINFVNIMLARSIQRNKEVGIRKVSGSSRAQLIFQFVSEAFLITLLAFIPAFIIVQLCLPGFSELAEKHFEISYLLQPQVLLLFGALLLVVSLLAGFYPAFVASGFKPAQTLYGRFKFSGKNVLGRSLVIMQFVIAIALMIGMVVFQRQFNYMTKSDLGYDPHYVLRVDFPSDKQAQLALFKNELAKVPAIELTGAKSGDWNMSKFKVNDRITEYTYFETIDEHFFQALHIPLVKGRYLSYANPADTVSNCMVNEAFVEQYLDKSRDPIGQTIVRSWLTPTPKIYTVTGVVRNYHSASFKEKIQPIYYSLDKKGNAFNVYVRYTPQNKAAAIAAAGKAFRQVLPYSTFEVRPLEDWNVERMYSTENRWKAIVSDAAIAAILISCLGLLALASLSVEQRKKEISIRKVLGASVTGILSTISGNFIKLVLIAFVIASPIAWWAMHNWLSDFSYRISLSWWIFLLVGILAVVVALLVICIQALRAAVMSPVKALRSE